MNNVTLWEVLCFALLYSVFCRAVKIDKTTLTSLKLAVWVMGLVAILGIGAPVYGWEPDVISMLLVIALLCMQSATAAHWVHGVPDQFVDPRFKKRRRRAGDVQ